MFERLLGRAPSNDVIVIGSGAAGLTAAIVAHDRGNKVLLLERSEKLGGTSAVSGGAVWIPCNNHMAELDESDTPELAFAYCKSLTMGRATDELLHAFIKTAPEMASYMEAHTPLRFTTLSTPDYHPEVAGGKLRGRTLEPMLFDASTLGTWRDRLRAPSMFPFPTPLKEVYEVYQAFYRPWRIPQDLIAERMTAGIVALGQALVAALLKGVLERGIEIRTSCRVQDLIRKDHRVVGVELAEGALSARRAVILATGGFEWNPELRRRFLTGEIACPNSPPANEGDGLLMAMRVGADLANMGETWNYPSIAIPGEGYDGQPLARGIKAERSGPHVIWVNDRGQRFVNEAANYNSVGKALYEMDANGPRYRNRPAWAVLDQQYRDRYAVGTTMPGEADPQWLLKDDSLAGLARQAGIDAEGLAETVGRWNGFVTAGKDRDFGRGESAFDRFQGDHEAPHPNLGTIEQPPFYAFSVHAGALGTKGGPRTDAKARVLDVVGNVIPGLFAAGNAAASVTGPSYFGVGSTLGPAMTFAYIAGSAVG